MGSSNTGVKYQEMGLKCVNYTDGYCFGNILSLCKINYTNCVPSK